MADKKQLERLKKSVTEWNEWRKRYPHIKPDLREADLFRANLIGADLDGAHLDEANLIRADLSGADLSGADLRRANLSGANLRGADLSGADLREAVLSGANLRVADLSVADLCGAHLSGADFSEALVGFTSFGDVDLSDVKGLDTVKHFLPSTIGIDTIYRSKGKIPDSFLRRCGVPNDLIEYIPSLVSAPFSYYSCFISYSHKDERFCKRLYNDLLGAGVRTWFFPEDATMGETIWGEIDRAIKIYDKLVVVCSKESLNSVPVLREIERGLQREDDDRKDDDDDDDKKKNVLFPITIDSYIFEEWEYERKADVLNKVVGDFKGWSRNAKMYEKEFQRMLKALQGKS